MTKYKLHWLDGTIEIITGYSISAAFRDAGYGNGASRGLDFWEEILSKSIEDFERKQDREPTDSFFPLLIQYNQEGYSPLPLIVHSPDDIAPGVSFIVQETGYVDSLPSETPEIELL